MTTTSEAVNAERSVLLWLANGERGLSSETMAFTALGIPCLRLSHPRDPDDFVRCLKLVLACPEVKGAFPQIAALSPQWKAVIDHWEELFTMLVTEAPALKGSAPTTYFRMKELGL